jgi:hypothetical protein
MKQQFVITHEHTVVQETELDRSLMNQHLKCVVFLHKHFEQRHVCTSTGQQRVHLSLRSCVGYDHCYMCNVLLYFAVWCALSDVLILGAWLPQLLFSTEAPNILNVIIAVFS